MAIIAITSKRIYLPSLFNNSFLVIIFKDSKFTIQDSIHSYSLVFTPKPPKGGLKLLQYTEHNAEKMPKSPPGGI
jgi:hypothetical protein